MNVTAGLEVTTEDFRDVLEKAQAVFEADINTINCIESIRQCKEALQALCDKAFEAGRQFERQLHGITQE